MEESVTLRVRLTPKGGRNALTQWEEGVLRVRVAAPPLAGAANKALIALLSDALDIPKSRIELTSGTTNREKALVIAGLNPAELRERIEAALRR